MYKRQPLLFVTPIAQSLAFLFLGEEIAGRDYPNWWWPIWAGYVAYGVAIVAGVAVGFGVAQVAPEYAGASAVATFFAGAFVFEPLIAWGAGIVGATDAEISGFNDTPGVPDTEVPPPEPPSEAMGFAFPTPLEVLGAAPQVRRVRAVSPVFGVPAFGAR